LGREASSSAPHTVHTIHLPRAPPSPSPPGARVLHSTARTARFRARRRRPPPLQPSSVKEFCCCLCLFTTRPVGLTLPSYLVPQPVALTSHPPRLHPSLAPDVISRSGMPSRPSPSKPYPSFNEGLHYTLPPRDHPPRRQLDAATIALLRLPPTYPA